MASLFNAVSINRDRYYFATQLDGEQQLTIDYPVLSGISTTLVGITGSQGNEVQINQMPVIIATEFMEADEGLAVGGASTYWTPSTINTAYAGLSLSTDRSAGSGIACIESYGTNGSTGGFEFLSRGVNASVLGTGNAAINSYISSIGRPDATAVLGSSGTFVTAAYQGSDYSSIDFPPSTLRGCYGIFDLSGGNTIVPRWFLGTTGPTTGSNVGSDFELVGFNDVGSNDIVTLSVRRSDGAVAIPNISSIFTEIGGTAKGQVFPILKDNTEFGAPTSNVTQITSTLQVLFSTPVANLNPNNQTLLNINWANSLSTGSNHVNYKIGFSTATAYTNIVQTSYVPGGSWTPSGIPGATTPIGFTNICAVLDPDGLDATGAGFLYVAGGFADPSAAPNQLFITKGAITEATRNALCYKTI